MSIQDNQPLGDSKILSCSIQLIQGKEVYKSVSIQYQSYEYITTHLRKGKLFQGKEVYKGVSIQYQSYEYIATHLRKAKLFKE